MLDCKGYRKLLEAVEKDMAKEQGDRCAKKLDWVVERAKHYAEKTGLKAEDLFDAWESKRDYWYMNYYQDANQPLIEAASVRVFDTVDEFLASIGKSGFRCPNCKGVSKNPYACDSGVKLKLINTAGPEVCNWKVYGLFGHMGKGIYVFVKEKLDGNQIFMPIAWEEKPTATPAPAEDDQAWVDRKALQQGAAS